MFSEDTHWPRNLVRWFGRTRYTHVHLEMAGCCLLGAKRGSGWYSLAVAERMYPTSQVVEIPPVAVDYHLLILLMSGWVMRNDIPGHFRWWFLGGPSPLNCVQLTCRALGHVGIHVDAATPDQLHDRLQDTLFEVRTKDHP